MTTSRMLSTDLKNLETKYEKKLLSVSKMLERQQTENGIKIYENCQRALEQVRRLQLIFNKTF